MKWFGYRLHLVVDADYELPVAFKLTKASRSRVNSRLDESFGFEKHYIRGLKKMKIKCGMALCVMLAMAVGRIKENQADKMRSLVKNA